MGLVALKSIRQQAKLSKYCITAKSARLNINWQGKLSLLRLHWPRHCLLHQLIDVFSLEKVAVGYQDQVVVGNSEDKLTNHAKLRAER